MSLGISFVIFLLAVIAIVAELILYFFLGIGVAFIETAGTLNKTASFFANLVIFTITVGIAAPVSAIIGTVFRSKKVR